MESRILPWYSQGAIYEQDDIDVVVDIMQKCVNEAKGFFRMPEERQFQEAFAQYEECRFASAVNSCGTGLDLALQVLEVGPFDEVITTPLTFVCTATCAVLRGANVVFADIDSRTYNLDPAKVEERITANTKVIIPVHFAGLPVDIEGFERLSQKYGVKIVYDAAHAAGSTYKGKKIGAFGDMTAFSFQSNKNMSTLGEGGAVTTDNEAYFTRLERLKSFGFTYGKVDDVVEAGTNLRMTKLQSAVGLTQLAKIDRNNIVRKKYANYLSSKLRDLPEIQIPEVPENYGHVFHLYTLLFDDVKMGRSRDDFMSLLKNKYNIGVTVHYKPVYEWAVFKKLGYTGEELPIASRVTMQLLNIPLFPWMTLDDFDYIANAIHETIAELKRG